MLRRRTVLGALVSLVAFGGSALPTAARVASAAKAAADALPLPAMPLPPMPLPPMLGGLPRTAVAHGPTLTTTVYAADGVTAQVMVTTGERGAGDGADARIAPTLRQLHDALIEVTRRQGGTVTLAGGSRTYSVGAADASWTWLGNVYDIESRGIEGPGQAARRLLLVTGHAGRLVIVSLDMARARDVDLRPLMDELSSVLARAR